MGKISRLALESLFSLASVQRKGEVGLTASKLASNAHMTAHILLKINGLLPLSRQSFVHSAKNLTPQ